MPDAIRAMGGREFLAYAQTLEDLQYASDLLMRHQDDLRNIDGMGER